MFEKQIKLIFKTTNIFNAQVCFMKGVKTHNRGYGMLSHNACNLTMKLFLDKIYNTFGLELGKYK